MGNYGYIYETTNNTNGKIYIGKRVGIFKSTYLGSGKNLKVAIKECGKRNFTVKFISDTYSEEEASELEKFYIKKFNSTDPDIGYNITKGGNGAWGPDSEETKAKKSKAGSTEERKQRMSKLGKEHPHDATICTCARCKSIRGEYKGVSYEEKYGAEKSKTVRNKSSLRQRGRKKPVDQIEKNRVAHIGTRAVHHPITNEDKRVAGDNVDQYLSKGWILGMSPKSKCILKKAAIERCHTKIYIYHSGMRKNLQIDPKMLPEFEKQGWKRGRRHKNWN